MVGSGIRRNVRLVLCTVGFGIRCNVRLLPGAVGFAIGCNPHLVLGAVGFHPRRNLCLVFGLVGFHPRLKLRLVLGIVGFPPRLNFRLSHFHTNVIQVSHYTSTSSNSDYGPVTHPPPGEGTRPTPPQNRPLVGRVPSPGTPISSIMRIAGRDFCSMTSSRSLTTSSISMLMLKAPRLDSGQAG